MTIIITVRFPLISISHIITIHVTVIL
jgi:hypothetical protein